MRNKTVLLAASLALTSASTAAFAQTQEPIGEKPVLSNGCSFLSGLGFTNAIGFNFYSNEQFNVVGTNTTLSVSGAATATIGPGNDLTYITPADGIYNIAITNGGQFFCSAAAPVLFNMGAELANAAANAGATAQVSAMTNGMQTNTHSRLGSGGSNTVSTKGFFLSTQNARSQIETSEYNVWASGAVRTFNGGLDGSGVDLVLGIDRMISDNALVGAMVGIGRTELTENGVEATSTSPSVGAYYARRINDGLIFDAHLAFARPELDSQNGSTRATRWSGSVSLTGDYAMAAGTLRPFVTLSGYSEDQPTYTNDSGVVAANEVTSYGGLIGARFESATALSGTNLKPYASLAANVGYTKSDAAGLDRFVAPRLALGASGLVGDGLLSVDLDGGKVRSDTYDVGMNVSYELRF